MGLSVEVLHLLNIQLGGHHLPEVWIFNDDDLAQHPSVIAIAKFLGSINIQVLGWKFMPRGEVFTMDKAPSLLSQPLFDRANQKLPEITKWELGKVVAMFSIPLDDSKSG